jgi:hypothetical protein
MDTVSYLKPKILPLIEYVVLLHNEQTIEVSCNLYDDLTSEDGDTTAYRFFKDKKIILELEGSAVRAIISKTDVNHLDVIKALKKVKPRRKKVVSV